jgi:LysM repeat protein
VQSPDAEEPSKPVTPQDPSAVPVVPATQEPAVSGGNPSANEPPAAEVARKVYRVVKGDSLAKIAKSHKVAIQALKDENQLKSNNLQIGQELVIPAR